MLIELVCYPSSAQVYLRVPSADGTSVGWEARGQSRSYSFDVGGDYPPVAFSYSSDGGYSETLVSYSKGRRILDLTRDSDIQQCLPYVLPTYYFVHPRLALLRFIDNRIRQTVQFLGHRLVTQADILRGVSTFFLSQVASGVKKDPHFLIECNPSSGDFQIQLVGSQSQSVAQVIDPKALSQADISRGRLITASEYEALTSHLLLRSDPGEFESMCRLFGIKPPESPREEGALLAFLSEVDENVFSTLTAGVTINISIAGLLEALRQTLINCSSRILSAASLGGIQELSVNLPNTATAPVIDSAAFIFSFIGSLPALASESIDAQAVLSLLDDLTDELGVFRYQGLNVDQALSLVTGLVEDGASEDVSKNVARLQSVPASQDSSVDVVVTVRAYKSLFSTGARQHGLAPVIQSILNSATNSSARYTGSTLQNKFNPADVQLSTHQAVRLYGYSTAYDDTLFSACRLSYKGEISAFIDNHDSIALSSALNPHGSNVDIQDWYVVKDLVNHCVAELPIPPTILPEDGQLYANWPSLVDVIKSWCCQPLELLERHAEHEAFFTSIMANTSTATSGLDFARLMQIAPDSYYTVGSLAVMHNKAKVEYSFMIPADEFSSALRELKEGEELESEYANAMLREQVKALEAGTRFRPWDYSTRDKITYDTTTPYKPTYVRLDHVHEDKLPIEDYSTGASILRPGISTVDASGSYLTPIKQQTFGSRIRQAELREERLNLTARILALVTQ